MKKLSLYLKVTALLLITVLIFSPLASFADDKAGTQTPNTTENTTDNSDNSTQLGGVPKDVSTDAVYVEYASNENFILSFSEKEFFLKVTDKRSGKEWCSTPPGVTNDKVSRNQPQRQSLIGIQFNDRSGNANFRYSSNKSVSVGGLKVDKIKDGVKMTFNFPAEKITIPVVITLTKTGFNFEVLTNECITENDAFTLTKVSILPFFGSSNDKNDGYLFVPDGQGALVDFKKVNGDVNADYRQPVYGRDSAKPIKAQTNFTEKVKMPVFGIKNNDSAFSAIIKEGDSRSEIVAITKGPLSSYNAVYPEFIYRDYDDIVAKEKSWDAKTFKVFESEMTSCEKFVVSYDFLNDEKANYVGMAENFRNYLINEKDVKVTAKPNYAPLNLELIGSIKRPVNKFGFPIDSVVPLTNFDDVKYISDKLTGSGVNDLVIDYKNWYKGSSEGIVPNKLNVDNALGGLNEFIELNKHLETINTKLFANVDITDLFKSGNGIKRNNDATRHLDMQPSMMYFYDRDTYQIEEWDKLKDTRFLLSPKKFVGVSENVVKDAKNQKMNFFGISDSGLSSKLYSDFGKNKIDKNESEEFVTQSLNNYASITGQLLVSDANAYAFDKATYVTSAPIQHSGYYTFTDSVPFYQIVLQGLMPHATIPVNTEGDVRNAVLKAVETGSQVSFKFVKQNIWLLKDTIYDGYINCDFEAWFDDTVAIYNEITPIISKLSDKTIVKHEILQKNVNRTTFSNGTKITVNFNYDDVTVDGETIKAQNYLVREAS